MAKQKDATVKVAQDVETRSLTVTFPKSGKVVTFKLPDPGSFLDKLALHGAEQKLRDAAAGKAANPAEAEASVMAVYDRLVSGEWATRRERTEVEEPIDVLAHAVVNVFMNHGKEISYTEIKDKLASMDKATRNGIRRQPDVAAELARLRPNNTSINLFEVLG
jgi:hypothetical protein